MIKTAVIGYGNVGKAAVEAVLASPDLSLVGVVRHSGGGLSGLPGVAVADSVENLPQKPQAAILALPSRMVPEAAVKLLRKGIATTDSFDIHGDIPQVRARLDRVAKENGVAAILSAGWDPGLDSAVRALLEASAPRGITYTDFGPGMSMGHTVAVKAITGVKDALSLTVPLGTGLHRRMVYVELLPGAELGRVEEAIRADPYFIHDETHVIPVERVADLMDRGHGVHLSRKGVSGQRDSQRFSCDMAIDNPALTGQLMASAARGAVRQQPGCYTMIEIPPIDLLPGGREDLVRRLV